MHYHYDRPPIGVPFQTPPLPAHFIPRPEVTNLLKSYLLTHTPSAPGVLVVSAIHGLGGIGKSTLAAALAYDPEVQRRFKDGILWATLGQEPDLLSLLSNWVQALGDYDFRPSTVEATSNHLRTLLQDKSILLVVDDVWNPEHAKPFRVVGATGQLLITTRRADVAEEVGAELHQMDVMTPEQSLALIATRLRRNLTEREKDQALLVAKNVGYLPLALELAAARLARGTTWAVLCEALESEIARLEALEGPQSRRTGTRLEASFNLSLRALRVEVEPVWQAFVWLGVLPEDVLITPPMAATVWDVDELEATNTLELLWNDALLLPGPPVQVEQREWLSYRLHDLLHDTACRLLTSPPPQGLGLKLSSAHATVLKHYQKLTRGNLWHTLRADGYIHTHLTWHMRQAQQPDQIHVLLGEETSDGQNGWYLACERLGQTANFMADLDTAWMLAAEESTECCSSRTIGLEVRYALIIASLNSLARNLHPKLLVALVEKGVWTPAQGLAYSRQIPEVLQQTEALFQLSLQLVEMAYIKEALTVAAEIQNPEKQSKALVGLIDHLSGREQKRIVNEILLKIKEIKPETVQLDVIVELASHLSPETSENEFREILLIVRSVRAAAIRAKLLARLADYLTEPFLREALAIARGLRYLEDRMVAFSGLIPRLAELGFAEEALTETRSVWDVSGRARILVRLAPHLPGPLLQEALTVARAIWYKDDRARVLIRLSLYLSPSERIVMLPETLLALNEIVDVDTFIKALTDLSPYLVQSEPQILQEVMAKVQGIEDKEKQRQTLTTLASLLPACLERDQIVEEIEAINNPRDCALSLIQIASHSSGQEQDEIIRKVSVAIAAIQNIEERVPVLATLLPLLSESERERISKETVSMILMDSQTTTDKKITMLASLASHLPVPLLREVLETTRAIRDLGDQLQLTVELAPYLSQQMLSEVIPAVYTVQHSVDRAKILARLVPHLSPTDQAVALADILGLVRVIPHTNEQARILLDVSPYLTPSLLEDALMIALEIGSSEDKAKVLAGLAPLLPQQLLEELVEVVETLKNQQARVQILIGLAPFLPEQLLEQILETGWQKESELANLVVGVAPYLSNALLAKALELVRDISYTGNRSKALIGLIPHLSEAFVQEALVIAQAIGFVDDRLQVLAYLVHYLSGPEQGKVLRQILVTIGASTTPRAKILAVIAPLLPHPLLHRALTVAKAIPNWFREDRARALAGLAPYVNEQEQENVIREAVKSARQIISIVDRDNELAKLATSLGELKYYERSLSTAKAIYHPTKQVRTLVQLAKYLPKTFLVEVLSEVQTARDTDDRAWALAELGPYLSEDLLGGVFAASQIIESPRARAQALTGLAVRLAELGHHRDAVAMVRTIEQGWRQARVLERLVPHLPETYWPELLTLTCEIDYAGDRAETLKALSSYLTLLPHNSLFPLWRSTLSNLAHRTRRNLLADLRALTPVAVSLSSSDVATEISQAAQDVGRWWP